MTLRKFLAPVLVALFLFLCAPVCAAEWISSGSIAMHGDAKYATDVIPPYVNKDAPKGGLLRLNIVGSFDSLNPFIVKGRAAEGVQAYNFESLMARGQDEPFTLYPLIAEKIDVKSDRSAIRFHLNPKAHWQDGTPITADDVLFSWNILKTKGRPNHRSYYGKVEKAERIDDHTVGFTFKKGENGVDREMPLIMGLMPVLPKHYWDGKNFDDTTLSPIPGSGPYKISTIEPGHSIIFTRDENYWGRDLPSRIGLFNFDTIRYDYYRDENIAQEAFTAHQIDARRETDPKRWAEMERVAQSKPNGFKTYAFKHQRPEPMRGFIFNTRRPLFDDVRVREALNNAFDFEWMNRTLWRGEYQRLESYFANSELAAAGLPSDKEQSLLAKWRKDLPADLFDKPFALPRASGTGSGAMRDNLLHAATLLTESRYTVQNGVLQDKAGKPFSFEILLSDPQDEKIALEFARMLLRLGITARVRTVDSAQFQSRLSDFDFDMILFRWVNSLSPGNEQMIYWGSAAADIKGSRNYAGIKSPVVDELAQKITSASTRDDLVAAAHALDRVLSWGYYMVPLAYRGADLFAIWPGAEFPRTLPLYGMTVESWWSGAKP